MSQLERFTRRVWRFRGRPAREQRAAFLVLTLLGMAARSLKRDGLARTEARLRRPPLSLWRAPTSVSPERLAQLVVAAADFIPDGTCLARSLTLARLLPGGGARVHIGVAPGGDTLDAHAWVELDGQVLNDSPDVGARFAVIETRTL